MLKSLDRIDYQDSVSLPCPAGLTIQDVLLGFFSSAPRFVTVLVSLRNFLVSLIGLKADRTPSKWVRMIRTWISA